MSQPEGRIYSRIAGTGSYLPENVLTNDDLAKLVDTSDEWIAARTGIRERHVAAEGETTSDLAYQASLRAMEAAGFHHAHIEVVEDLRVALGDGVADQTVVRDPGVPVQHRVGRERGLGQSRDDRRFR